METSKNIKIFAWQYLSDVIPQTQPKLENHPTKKKIPSGFSKIGNRSRERYIEPNVKKREEHRCEISTSSNIIYTSKSQGIYISLF